jgi:xanthine dehydrogenase YagS FAD-binding subunit
VIDAVIFRPSCLADASEKLGHGAQPIASGGDLLGLMKTWVEGPTLPLPTTLVDLAALPELRGLTFDGGRIRIGAMTPLAALQDAKVPRIFGEAIAHIASPQLRNRTTIGGNLLQRPRCYWFRNADTLCFKKGGQHCLAIGGPDEAWPGALTSGRCHAGHPSDLAPVLLALGAEVELWSTAGSRTCSIETFFENAANNPHGETSLGQKEILLAVHLPANQPFVAYCKIAPREANEFAWTTAALAAEITDGAISGLRLGLGGIAPGPILWTDRNAITKDRSPTQIDADAAVADILGKASLASQYPARRAAMREAIRSVFARIGESKSDRLD